MVTHGDVLGGQPRHCICTDASRGLSARAKYLVICTPLLIKTELLLLTQVLHESARPATSASEVITVWRNRNFIIIFYPR